MSLDQHPKWSTGIVLAASVAGMLAALPAAAQTRGGTLTVALPYDIDTLNPYSTGFLPDVASTVLEGLVAPDDQARYVPVLATEVPTLDNGLITLSADKTRMVVTYHLRPGVQWADGEPLTAADVRFTWEAVRDPKFIAESKAGTADIDSIETPDPLTVVVKYNTVSPVFASDLFTRGVLPEHLLKGKNLNTDPFNEKLMGTGPFMVTEFKRGQYAVVERNPHYWRKDDKGVQLPYLDRMIFKILPDQNAMVTQLKSGEIQYAYNIPYGQAAQFTNHPDLKIISNPILSWQHLDFNFKGPASLQVGGVRQAIAHAINKTTIAKALGGFPFTVKSVVVPTFPYYDADAPDYPFDVAKAKQLLDQAGYVPGTDGIRAKGGERLSYKLVVQAGLSADEIAEQVIIANLKAVGIEAIADNKNGVAFRDARYKGGYDLLYARWITSADPSYSVFFGTKGPNNGQGYSNPALDALLDKVEHTLAPGERLPMFKEMQKILASDAVTVPTTSNVSLIAVTRKLVGTLTNPTNRTDFINTSGWYLAK